MVNPDETESERLNRERKNAAAFYKQTKEEGGTVREQLGALYAAFQTLKAIAEAPDEVWHEERDA